MMSTPVRRAWALSLFWIAVIVAESVGGSSDNTGSLLYPLLKLLFPRISLAHMILVHVAIRKAGHFIGFFILSLVLYRSWWTTLAARTAPDRLSWRDLFQDWNWRAALLALLGTLVVAGLDEWHQSFVPGRGSSIADVLLDESGGFLAQLIILMVSSVAIPRTRRRHAEPQAVTSA